MWTGFDSPIYGEEPRWMSGAGCHMYLRAMVFKHVCGVAIPAQLGFLVKPITLIALLSKIGSFLLLPGLCNFLPDECEL